MINFHPFEISVFYSFCYWFSIKFLKLFLVSVFFFFWGGGGGRGFFVGVFFFLLGGGGGQRLLVACFN